MRELDELKAANVRLAANRGANRSASPSAGSAVAEAMAVESGAKMREDMDARQAAKARGCAFIPFPVARLPRLPI